MAILAQVLYIFICMERLWSLLDFGCVQYLRDSITGSATVIFDATGDQYSVLSGPFELFTDSDNHAFLKGDGDDEDHSF